MSTRILKYCDACIEKLHRLVKITKTFKYPNRRVLVIKEHFKDFDKHCETVLKYNKCSVVF